MQEGRCIFCEGKEFVISQSVPSMKYVVLKCVTCGAAYEYKLSDKSLSPEQEAIFIQGLNTELGDE